MKKTDMMSELMHWRIVQHQS